MSWYKIVGSAVLASTVLLVGCGDDKAVTEDEATAPATEQPAEPSAMDTLKKEAGETLEAAGEAADEMGEKAAEMGEQIKQDASEVYDKVESGTRDLSEQAAEKAAELEQDARDQMDAMKQDGEQESAQ